MNRIYFTADLHFGHVLIGKHMPDRPFSNDLTTVRHDEWLVELWRNTVDDKDTVYILGDITLMNKERASELLERLPGRKILICGNHDSTVRELTEHFAGIRQLHEIAVTPHQCELLKYPLRITMCHYPLLTWRRKAQGCIMLHGHSHGKMDEINRASPDLRWDVGLDGSLSRSVGAERGTGFALIDMESLYRAILDKTGTADLKKYVRKCYGLEKQPESYAKDSLIL